MKIGQRFEIWGGQICQRKLDLLCVPSPKIMLQGWASEIRLTAELVLNMDRKVVNMYMNSTPMNMNMYVNVNFMNMNIRSMTRNYRFLHSHGSGMNQFIVCPVGTYLITFRDS